MRVNQHETGSLYAAGQPLQIAGHFAIDNSVTVFKGDCLDLLKEIPDDCVQLIVTSPPYNIGKEYEKKIDLSQYIKQQGAVIKECVRVLKQDGSICWQVGNYIEKGRVFPLDIQLYSCFAEEGLNLRNRIIWHFGHGLHCSKRFSGRYETIMWFTKSDDYVFNLDPIRTPQKYPGKKHFKGAKAGQYSCNPKGKNPSDVWDIPNVKHNHAEKTIHPCQFPIALVQRLILALSNERDIVFDPFMGVGTALAAAVINNRKAVGSEIVTKYIDIAKERIIAANEGRLKIRPDVPIFLPDNGQGKDGHAVHER